MSEMRVLILGSKEYPMGSNSEDPLPSGGMEVYIENLVTELKKKPLQIIIISRIFRGTNSFEHMDNIKIFRVNWINNFFLRTPSFNFNAFLKALHIDYDIIFCNGLIASFFGIIVSTIRKKPLILCPAGIASVQPQYNSFLQSLLKMLERFTYSRGDLIIFLSDEEKQEFFRKMNFLPETSIIIPTGISGEKFSLPKSESLLKAFNIRNKRVLTFVGRLIKTKGIEYLIDAISLLKNDNYVVLIVGDGPDYGSLNNLVKRKKLQEKVIFTGFRRDIPEILSITDIFVLPSLSEGLPIALLEAMAGGCACVVTDIGLPIKDRETGLVVPPANPEILADRIDGLLTNPEYLNTLKVNARDYVILNHSWKNAADDYMEIFFQYSK
jgi:glycosyltransferase involved in cell wall biosynthesis